MIIGIIGLPRSGKSTLAAEFAKRGFAVVSKDAIRLALHGQRYLAKAEVFVKDISRIQIESLLSYDCNIVIDETNLTPEKRDLLVKTYGDIIWVNMTTPPEVCKKRAEETNQSDLLPIIDSMDKDLVFCTSSDSIHIQPYAPLKSMGTVADTIIRDQGVPTDEP